MSINSNINREALKKVLHGTRDERKFLCSRDFSLFFIYYYIDYIKYPFAPFHFDMFQDLRDLETDELREILWLMFRESAKTSIAKAYVNWLICYKKRKYINVDSFDKENAERILFDIVVEMQTNPRILADFGELFNQDRSKSLATQKRINNFVTNNGIRVEAHSTQESVRGRIHGHQRPDFLLLDDFETNKTKDSVAYTEQVRKHINEFKTGLDGNAKIIYLGNYITELGSIQDLIDRSKEDRRLRVRNVPVLYGDMPSWPSKYCLTDLEAKLTGKISLEDKKRQFGPAVFSAEMMNQPIDEETQKFFKDWFIPITMEEVMKMRTRKFATIDTALSKSANSDFTGVTKNYVSEANIWHLSAKRYKIGPKELVNLIFQLHDEGFEKIGIEETAYTEAIKPFFVDECRIRNKYPNVVPLKHGGIMKETRIMGLEPKYSARDIRHIVGECSDLEEELIRFPKAIHDDVSDSAAYQLKIAEPPFKQSVEQAYEEEEPLFAEIGI